MITKTFFSDKNSFLFCIKDLKNQISNFFDSYDFLIFSIHSTLLTENINLDINTIFQTDDFVAFYTNNIFIDDKIKEKGVGVFVVKFEKKGKANIFSINGLSDENLIKTIKYLNKNKNKFHLLIASGKNICNFIENLSDKLEYTLLDNIAGSVIANTTENEEYKSMIFVDNMIVDEGIAIISFENIEWKVGISSGFIPYGITYKIAKAENTKIYTVDDGKNFAYLFKKLLDGIKNPDIRYTWYMPIYILNKDKGYISSVRTVKDITDKYVDFYANISEGDCFKLSFATKDELLKEDKKIACKISNKLKNIEAVFNFSCLARQYVLEDKQQKEIEIYTNTFDAHLFGFFTAGEIAPNIGHDKLLFYNETSVLVVLKEK